jgi:magnesium transporter
MTIDTEKPRTFWRPSGITDTSQLDDNLIERLQDAFNQSTQDVVLHDVAKIASEHSAVDLAVAASRLPSHARVVLFQNLSTIGDKSAFMIHTDSATRIAIFREISSVDSKLLIEQMPPDEAVEVLEDMSERTYRKVIGLVEKSKAARIREIEKNARNTAGRLMTNEFFSFLMDVTIGEASQIIRNHPGIDFTSRIFVVDESGHILGYVPSRNMIINPPELPLRQVMRPVQQKVSVDTSREEVAELVERYTISSLPVIDDEERLIGVITYDDVIDALEDILDETIGALAGTAEKVSEYEPHFKRFLSRAPWLLVTLCAGLINVGVISSFESHVKGFLTFVLFFVPLVTGMSGNIGIQSSTVLVRSIALGHLTSGKRREAMFKELLLGLFNACFFGVLCGVLIYLLNFAGLSASPLYIGIIVGAGLFGACLSGAMLGVLSPFLFSRIGVDPAVASGPIVTAMNDFLSMSIYFLIAIGISSLIL